MSIIPKYQCFLNHIHVDMSNTKIVLFPCIILGKTCTAIIFQIVFQSMLSNTTMSHTLNCEVTHHSYTVNWLKHVPCKIIFFIALMSPPPTPR